MNIAIFGLGISSSWGNGHATLWRGLITALAARGHRVVFFERNVEWYAAHRDLFEISGGRLVLYGEWKDAVAEARREMAAADVAIITSYCPDAVAAASLMFAANLPLRVFYDLDTPVTLAKVAAGEMPPYIGPRRLADYDLVLSFTGGEALAELSEQLGARRVAPLYGSVDPAVHRPVPPRASFHADLSYLGTYAADRQASVEELFVAPARLAPTSRFVLGGSGYPDRFPWTSNIYFVRHLPPGEHPGFYSSSRLTLNVTRGAMAAAGWCPSGRLFEAAACGTAILSDRWRGLEVFFEPGKEILLADNRNDVLQAMQRSDGELRRIGQAARDRALAEHTAAHRADELIRLIERAHRPEPAMAGA